jgi:hypothetical protein
MTRGTDDPGASWRKSSYSNGDGGDCVEVARPGAGLWVRDSKCVRGPVVHVGPAAWGAFLTELARR